MKDKQGKIERLNDWLRERPGEIFARGKWRFWFPLVIGLTFLNGALTAWIFGGAGVYMWLGVIVATVGALLCWLEMGNLHYSDSPDPRLARGVSLLDSVTLVFVIAHFCFLLWTLGHLLTLREAEAKYGVEVEAFNVKAANVQADNVKIAEAAQAVARETTKAERLRRQTAYQQRKAAEAGYRAARSSARAEIAPGASLSTAPVELERPKAPGESSAAFLGFWDRWIRIANFGELILAAITLIYIRNRSASYNAPYLNGNAPRIDFQDSAHIVQPASVAALRQGGGKDSTPVATDRREAALSILRDHLGVIASGLPNWSFKADLRRGAGVWIRLYESRKGRETMLAKTCQSDKLLAAVNRPDFRERLIDELIRQGFPIGDNHA